MLLDKLSVHNSPLREISQTIRHRQTMRLAAQISIGALFVTALVFLFQHDGTTTSLRAHTRYLSTSHFNIWSSGSDHAPPKPKYAFAVLLSPNFKPEVDQKDTTEDDYFLGTRVLNYQLRHSKKTRFSDPNVPLLVLTPETVSDNKRKILAKEGATIVPIEAIKREWIVPPLRQWEYMMSKLWLWSFTEFDRILYLDADIFLVDSLDGVFDDAGAQEYSTDYNKTSPEEARLLPPTYSIGGVLDGVSGDRDHPAYADYMNGGFFMIKPDITMFNYYMHYVDTPDSFSLSMLEQNLMNQLHRGDGPMPWQRLDKHWDTSCPTPYDIENGWKTLHGKYWALHAEPCDIDPYVGRLWYQTYGEMEAFYAAEKEGKFERSHHH